MSLPIFLKATVGGMDFRLVGKQMFRKSQIQRITKSLMMEGSSGDQLLQPPAKQGQLQHIAQEKLF